MILHKKFLYLIVLFLNYAVFKSFIESLICFLSFFFVFRVETVENYDHFLYFTSQEQESRMEENLKLKINDVCVRDILKLDEFVVCRIIFVVPRIQLI